MLESCYGGREVAQWVLIRKLSQQRREGRRSYFCVQRQYYFRWCKV